MLFAAQKIHPQGTFDWYCDRWGKITMSVHIKTLMDGHVHTLNKLLQFIRWQHANRNKETMAQEFERETRLGDNVEALSWGRAHEDESIKQYELSRNVKVIRPGFVEHPDFPSLVGDSTDFIESDDGTITGNKLYACEIKCPLNSAIHRSHLRYGMPQEHYHQTQGHMEVHNLPEGKFVSYDPRHPIENDKLYVQMLQRDMEWHKRFYDRMDEFSHHFKTGSQFQHQVGGIKDGIPSMF